MSQLDLEIAACLEREWKSHHKIRVVIRSLNSAKFWQMMKSIVALQYRYPTIHCCHYMHVA